MIYSRWLIFILLWMPVTVTASSSHALQAVLERTRSALESLEFEGRMRWWQGAAVSWLDIEHRLVEGEVIERILHPSAHQREVIRRGNTAVCRDSEGKVTRLSVGENAGPLVGIVRTVDPANPTYSLSHAGNDRFLDRDSDKYAIMALDAFRYSYLLWVDQKSGLPLQQIITDQKGDEIEYWRFESLTVPEADSTPPAQGSAAAKALIQRFRDLEARARPLPNPSLEQQDLSLTPGWLPAGFARIDQPHSSDGKLSYSDGLSEITIFIEPLDGSEMPEGEKATGAMSAVTLHYPQLDSPVAVTVVGRVPLVSVRQIARTMKDRPR